MPCEAMDFETVTAEGYGFQIEMTHRLVRAGGRIVEFPIAFRDRRAGESKLSHGIVNEAFGLVGRLWVDDRRGRRVAAVGRADEPGRWAGDSDVARLRTILHVDMDAFFVAVELRRRPELRGQPVVVGGTGRRGVVAAASYEARRYGVFSALPSAVGPPALPDAVFLPGDHAAYAEASSEVHAIFDARHTARRAAGARRGVPRRHGRPRPLGDGVDDRRPAARATSTSELDLRCSVGVATNKFLAKLASVDAKPRATPERGRARRRGLRGRSRATSWPTCTRCRWPAVGRRPGDAASDWPGWGCRPSGTSPRSTRGRARPRSAGPTAGTCSTWPPAGTTGRSRSSGRSSRSATRRRSPTTSTTLAELQRELVRLADAVAARLRRHGVGARTFTVKVRDGGVLDDHPGRHRRRRRRHRPAHRRRLGPLLGAVDLAAGVRLLGLAASRFAAAGRAAQPRRPRRTSRRRRPPALVRRQPGDRRRAGAVRGRRRSARRAAWRSGPTVARRCGSCAPARQQWGPTTTGAAARDAEHVTERRRPR